MAAACGELGQDGLGQDGRAVDVGELFQPQKSRWSPSSAASPDEVSVPRSAEVSAAGSWVFRSYDHFLPLDRWKFSHVADTAAGAGRERMDPK